MNNILKRRAVIFGIKGFYLTPGEKNLLLCSKPWGVILFSRNIKNIFQLKSLIFSIKVTTKNEYFPILIDQEGGKVSRINNIVDLSLFSQDYFGQLYNINKKIFFYNYKKYIHLVCNIFKKVGININTVPVLDVYRKSSHNIIGTRSFSSDP
jgi:beta-N-acetylhexosaminidase